MAAFVRYVGIDYSGARTPAASLKRLRVYMAERSVAPGEVVPPPSPTKYWTRRRPKRFMSEVVALQQRGGEILVDRHAIPAMSIA